MSDECIVGRGLVNEALTGWVEPCRESATEEYIVPNLQAVNMGVLDQDVWPMCAEHGKQFRKALNEAEEGACN